MLATVDPVSAGPEDVAPDPSMPADPSVAGDRLLFVATVEHVRSQAEVGLRVRRFAHRLGLDLRGDGGPFPGSLRAVEFRARLRVVASAVGPASEHAAGRLEADLAAGLAGCSFDPEPLLFLNPSSLHSARAIVRQGLVRHGWPAPEDVLALLGIPAYGKHRIRAPRPGRRP
jgi:hypothetical protein